jgi:hypothetical protein
LERVIAGTDELFITKEILGEIASKIVSKNQIDKGSRDKQITNI